MTENIEIEFKNMLTKTEYQRLLKKFTINHSQIFTQQNYYFDTPQFDLKEKGAALRIRQKGNQYELTLKEPAAVGLLETNQTITLKEANDALELNKLPEGKIKNQIAEKGIYPQKIIYFGLLETHRCEFNYKNGLLVFDHSVYLNMEDFELEYEAPDYQTGKKTFLEFLSCNGIPERKTENKIRRFYIQKQKGIKAD